MMKRFILFTVLISFLFSPCLAKKFYNTPFLEKVERTPPSDQKIIIKKDTNTYKDELMEIIWDPAPRGFEFKLSNISDIDYSIFWQESFLSDPFNKYTIVHRGIKSIRNIPPSEVGAGKSLDDFLYPAAFARFVRGRYTELRQKSIYKKKLKQSEVDNFEPQTFSVTLAVQTGDTRYTYKFYFKTEAVEK